jgi:hypothetical protein
VERTFLSALSGSFRIWSKTGCQALTPATLCRSIKYQGTARVVGRVRGADGRKRWIRVVDLGRAVCPHPPSRYLCFSELVILLGHHPFGRSGPTPIRSARFLQAEKRKGALTGVPPRTRQFRRPQKEVSLVGAFELLTAQ